MNMPHLQSVRTAAFLSMISAALAACAPAATHVSPAATEASGELASERIADPKALPTVPLWTHKGKSYFGSKPVAGGNRLILPTHKGRLEYVDPNSGKRASEAKAKYTLESPPVITGDRMFLVTDYPRKRLQALGLSSGKRLWHRDFRVTLGQPIQVDEELWVPVGDTIAAFTLEKGEPIRAIVSGGDRWLTPSPGPGGFALLGARGTLRFLDSSGTMLWQHELDELCAVPPVISNGNVIVATAGGAVAQVRSSKGEVWRRTLASGFLHAPTVVDGIVYVVGRDGTLWALDESTGETVWQQTLGAPGAGSALVRGDWLAATSVDGKLWFLDRMDGTVRDSVVFDALIHHAPVWAFGRLYVVTADKRAHAFGMGP